MEGVDLSEGGDVHGEAAVRENHSEHVCLFFVESFYVCFSALLSCYVCSVVLVCAKVSDATNKRAEGLKKIGSLTNTLRGLERSGCTRGRMRLFHFLYIK